MANIYDGAFRTILNDCRKLIIPIINEIFGETYTGKEEIQFFPNEHFINQQDEADKERITDTNFTVYGKIPKKYHVECESSLPGGTVQYDVPIMKVQTYSRDDIFEKGLLMLIPFYIFSHEKSFPEYNSNEQKLEELKAEYQEILERLDELEQQGVIGAFDKRTIIELSGDVIKEIAQKYENVQKGVGDMMGGALIETEARTILNQGIIQGIRQGKSQGISETKKQTALKLLKRGKLTVEEIAEDTGLSVTEVEQLSGLQTV